MQHDELVYLGQMFDCALRARDMARGATKAEFDGNEMLRLALRHLIQTTGEAARKVPDSLRAKMPGVPWARIVGMRHRIVHDYDNIDDDVVWQVVTDDLPKLVAMLEPIVPPGLGP